ncbi:uncharacterized protein BDV17DRAFT_291426 [Aspergillus undulatus]|uniref:uncharacterized protein n=1 Tax=Aspergillus undulatus TaxID=1810928 RepID=UPI003CCE1C5D
MKLFSSASLVHGLFYVASALAARSFSGSNLYYATGLTDAQSTTLLEGLQSAGVKVLRANPEQLRAPPLNDFASLQGNSRDSYDDTILNRLDDFMVKAHDYGIKLLISIHSYNALEAGSDFYANTEAIGYFKDRIAHVLAHVNPNNGKTWAKSPKYIFAFEAQNEAMHLQDNLAGNKIILFTTGSGAYLANSLLDDYLTCDALDILAITQGQRPPGATVPIATHNPTSLPIPLQPNPLITVRPQSLRNRVLWIKLWAELISMRAPFATLGTCSLKSSRRQI